MTKEASEKKNKNKKIKKTDPVVNTSYGEIETGAKSSFQLSVLKPKPT